MNNWRYYVVVADASSDTRRYAPFVVETTSPIIEATDLTLLHQAVEQELGRAWLSVRAVTNFQLLVPGRSQTAFKIISIQYVSAR